VGDEIDLQEAGAGVIPFGEGADGDLVLEPGAGAGRAQAARGRLRPRRREEPPEGRGAGLAKELVDLGGDLQRAALHQTVQELGHEGMQPMGANVAGGLPHHDDRGGERRAVERRAPGVRRPRWGAEASPEQPDDALAMQACDRDDLVQQRALLGAAGPLVPLLLPAGVLPKAGSRHGALLRGIW